MVEHVPADSKSQQDPGIYFEAEAGNCYCLISKRCKYMKNFKLKSLYVRKKERNHQIFTIMKLSAVFLLIATLQVAATGYAQNVTLDLKMENTPMREVFKEIERKSELSFIFSDDVSTLSNRVSVNMYNTNINDILAQLFINTDLSYQILNEKLIVIAPKAALQQITVTGTVTDVKGEPLPGVTIMIKGATQGTATDVDGAFSLPVQDGNATLIFSFIGFISQEVTVGSRRTFSIELVEDARQLEEVIVIGYGTVRKSDLTGSVVSISEKQFRDQPTRRIGDILQGRTAGVAVTTTSGMIGTSPTVRIRGITSINKSSDPLYVVDGIIGGSIHNTSDIKSIEVLKDASATAIYGSRGANGVVLVTTKGGEAGKTRVSLDIDMGMSKIIKKYDLLNAYEYAQALNDFKGAGTISAEDMEAYKNGTMGIDWQDILLKTGYDQDYKLNISGGTQKNRYYVSANVLDQTAITITSRYQRYQFRAKIDTEVTPWLNMTTNLNMGHSKSHNTSISLFRAFNYSPTMELKNPETGVYNVDPYNSLQNSPYGERVSNYSDNFSYVMNGNFNLVFKIVDGLTFSVLGGINYSQSPRYSFVSKLSGPTVTNGMTNDNDFGVGWQNTDVLTYQKSFNDHHVTATAAWEISQSESKNLGINGSNLSDEIVGYWNYLNAATRSGSNSYSASSMTSGIFRVMYNYKNRYFLTGTYRADGASKFQGDNKWGYFPSGAIAWDLAKEDFFSDQTIFQQLKLRGSFGVAGNADIAAYSTLGLLTRTSFSYATNTAHTGYWANSFTSPFVSWEKAYQYDAGLDFSVLESRVNVSIDWFLKETKDLLFQKQVPVYNGGGTYWVNMGEVKNAGFETSITAYPVRKKDFMWETTFNASYVKNEVIKLDGRERILGANMTDYGGEMQAMQIGYPVSSFLVYQWEGFDDAGCNLYRAADGNLTISPVSNDRIIMGQADPNWTFGWNNMFRWKNWTANIFMNAATGFDRLNMARYSTALMFGNNRFISLRDSYFKGWDYVSNKADARYPNHRNGDNKNYANTTLWLENASFLKVKNISISYYVPKDVMKLMDAEVSLSVQNICTFTNYTGMDPEVYNSGTGIDQGAYPMARTFTLGLKLNF